MNTWLLFMIIYILVALITFIPTFIAIIRRIKLHPGGTSFEDSTYFSNENKEKLVQHYSRIQGTLKFWKNQAEKYRRFHYYCMCWAIPASIVVPILTQYVSEDSYSKGFYFYSYCYLVGFP